MPTIDQLNEALKEFGYPLTTRQFKFVLAYAQHGVGMRAVREAGYKHSTQGSQSSAAFKLLQSPRIRRAIEIIKGDVGRPVPPHGSGP